jgi:hypothetical protein
LRLLRRVLAVFVELADLIEARTAVIVSRVFLRVNTIYGAGIDAGGVSCPNAGFGNDIGHGPPPLSRSTHYASAPEDSSGGQGFPQSNYTPNISAQLIGQNIRQYHILEKVGRGMGVVYKAVYAFSK